MLLKRIEIHGFKSFAEKTEFEMGEGVTCLVGPNGCGKSNVVDAVKWALGEQRPTALRGDSMGDVIFKGNGRRPPMGFAEVSLVFDNAAGELPVDVTEVAITRRLYRDGESEYLINRRPCRLKDVRELFFDTGLGQNAYAVLEQGRIDAILRANPVDRRSIFEEAAGIQRFRARKREAARKLEKVDQNLLRVADVIEELERRVRSLRIQAGRARSYVELSDRLTELKTVQFLCAGAEMEVRVEALRKDLDAARELDRASDQDLEAATRLVEAVDAETEVSRESIARLRNRKVELRGEIETAETRRAALEERDREAREAAAERGARGAELAREIDERRGIVESLGRQIEEESVGLASAEIEVTARRQALAAEQADAERGASEVERLEREILRQNEVELASSNALASLASHARGLQTSRERLVRREAELAGLVERVRDEARTVLVERTRLDEEAREKTESIADAIARLEERREREQEIRRRLGEVRASVAAKASRRETLDDVIEKMEGVDEGSRALVRAARSSDAVIGGVRGLLAELVSVPADRARALDAALGPLAGAVVVDDEIALRRALEYLRREKAGAATFLVLDRPGRSAGDAGGPGERLLDDVEGPVDLDAVLRGVLGEARVVDEDVLLAEIGRGRFLVTRDGARLDATGAFTERPYGKTLGFVERKVERDRLAREVEVLGVERVALEEEEARLGVEVTEWTALVAEAEGRRREIEAGIVERRSQEQRLADRAAIYQRELSVCARERLEIELENAALVTTRVETEVELAAARREREVAEAERREIVRRREAHTERLEALQRAEGEAAQEVIRRSERTRGLKAERQHLERALGEQEASRARLDHEVAELTKRASEAAAAVLELVVAIDRRRAEDVENRARLEEAEAQAERGQVAVQAAREAAMAAARAREEARERVHRIELQERELEMSRAALRDRAADEISLDVDDRLREFDPASVPSLEDINSELATVRDKISRIGNVNLDAIQELEEVESRLEFLAREKADLDLSRKSLHATIAELDGLSRERFVETFEAVREHFRALFRKLFHGGKADVKLEDGVDVLDAGIEIYAGPPGKDPRSITLLSGGERTMTAVALLFALFKAKPSPVAILDEVDAALDEANTERFCSILSEFIGSTQFMIVTHSKRTMTYADVIFGVTMQESGVSKRIGLRLETQEEQVA